MTGEAATEAGLPILAGTEDLRLAYEHINATRDMLAVFMLTGTWPASRITGTLDAARIPSLDQTKVTAAGKLVAGGMYVDGAIIGGQFTVSNGLGVLGAFAANGQATLPDAYARSVAGMGGYRTLNVAANGVLGGLTSSRRFKNDIDDAQIPLDVLRSLRVVVYRYKLADGSDEHHEPLQLGLIAEEVEDAGLAWLVDHDDDGLPFGLVNQAMPFLPLLLAQQAHDRLDDVESTGAAKNRRITELENTVADLTARLQKLEARS